MKQLKHLDDLILLLTTPELNNPLKKQQQSLRKNGITS